MVILLHGLKVESCRPMIRSFVTIGKADRLFIHNYSYTSGLPNVSKHLLEYEIVDSGYGDIGKGNGT